MHATVYSESFIKNGHISNRASNILTKSSNLMAKLLPTICLGKFVCASVPPAFYTRLRLFCVLTTV